MKNHYRVLVVGGGVVGASVLYHLARSGWTDVALIERSELTAGSTWHAAAGFHALNGDAHISALQTYTIALYEQIQRESDQDVGLHMTGGISLASSPERWEWLKSEWGLLRSLDIDAELLTPSDIAARCPIVNLDGVEGGLWDPNEGHLDPHGATHAYVKAAKRKGASLILRNRVISMVHVDGNWRVETEQGVIVAEHIVNAGGLWARRLANMVGIDLPVIPMEHHYLLTEDVPSLASWHEEIPSITDLDGYTYLRQEANGVLLGVYERNPRHWSPEGAPWEFGMELLPDDLERISEELSVGFERFPELSEVGIKRWVNGAFTFTPDGNPLVGPVPGLQNYWAACGCMAGFSQGGAIGLALANWMVDGDPGADVFGMDVARFGSFACDDRYLRDTTAQFYARRFALTYPNEELPAGRPLKMSPCYEEFKQRGARFGEIWGMETPLFFVPDQPTFEELPSLRRSNAHGIIDAEVRATRSHAGLFETSIYARYEVSGPEARNWLDWVMPSRLPAPGRVRLAPMLNHNGMLMGDLTVSSLADDRYWLVGSYSLQEWHLRWLRGLLPKAGVTLRNLSDDWMGFSLSGPKSREIVEQITGLDISDTALKFLGCRELAVAGSPAVLARVSLTGELGYELTVPVSGHHALWRSLTDAGEPLGMCQLGLRALDSLRFEKGYGVWSTEYAQCYTPGMAGLDGFIDFGKADFIGREAALRERDKPSKEVLTLFEVHSDGVDAVGFEPIWLGDERVGHLTSGAYGHSVSRSLAMGYINRSTLSDHQVGEADISTHLLGERVKIRALTEAPFDPDGHRLRS